MPRPSRTARSARRAWPRLVLLARDTRGAAMTEAVIVLPVFVMLFAFVHFFFGGFKEQEQDAQQARQALWAEALPGCPQGDPDLALLDQCKRDDFNLQVGAFVRLLAPFFDTVKLTEATGSASGEVARPPVIGGGTVAIRQRLTTTCDELDPNRVPGRNVEAVMAAIVADTFCRFAGCGGSPGECQPAQTECVGELFERECVAFGGVGAWDAPFKCKASEVCYQGRCTTCDPTIPPGTVVGPGARPPCAAASP